MACTARLSRRAVGRAAPPSRRRVLLLRLEDAPPHGRGVSVEVDTPAAGRAPSGGIRGPAPVPPRKRIGPAPRASSDGGGGAAGKCGPAARANKIGKLVVAAPPCRRHVPVAEDALQRPRLLLLVAHVVRVLRRRAAVLRRRVRKVAAEEVRQVKSEQRK